MASNRRRRIRTFQGKVRQECGKEGARVLVEHPDAEPQNMQREKRLRMSCRDHAQGRAVDAERVHAVWLVQLARMSQQTRLYSGGAAPWYRIAQLAPSTRLATRRTIPGQSGRNADGVCRSRSAGEVADSGQHAGVDGHRRLDDVCGMRARGCQRLAMTPRCSTVCAAGGRPPRRARDDRGCSRLLVHDGTHPPRWKRPQQRTGPRVPRCLTFTLPPTPGCATKRRTAHLRAGGCAGATSFS